MNTSNEKLFGLRALMSKHDINVYIIPSSDPHLGEYVPDNWRIIEWLTGFTGSAATILVSDSFAGLWTDSRYFIQADDQLHDSEFIVMKPVIPGKNDFIAWLYDNISDGSKIGLNSRCFSIEMMRKIQKSLENKKVTFDVEYDLYSDLWTDRPPSSDKKAFDHPVAFCGKERSSKISEVKEQMRKMNVDYHLLTSIDDIMWLLNIRGSDVKYSPLMTSFALVYDEQILLFTDENKIPLKIAKEFDELNIVLLPYEETEGILFTLSSDSSILITPGTTSVSIYNAIPKGIKIIEDISIPSKLKAVKNKVEIENIGKVMIRDGVALTKFFYWLEQNIGISDLSELSVITKLESLRSEQENFLYPSFSTIAAWNEHGALPHYSPTLETDSTIENKGILLVDSGGQYLDGTTDITRTIVFGRPNQQQKKDFTLVLRGNISIALAKFPSETKGYQIDILARKALWDNGLNYGHGTGHGVGFFLNVHEGPQNISPVTGAASKTDIEPGMLISNEPAIYREGEYGIRIENLVLCYEDEVTEFGRFLKFDTLSLCYIDKSLIDISLLDNKEIEWLNDYHAEVYEKLSPYLTESEKLWLIEKTKAL